MTSIAVWRGPERTTKELTDDDDDDDSAAVRETSIERESLPTELGFSASRQRRVVAVSADT